MDLKKIGVKFFTRGADDPPLADFISVFHSWIQETDGAYFDVADYTHVNAGPGVLLVAHEANVSLDEQDQRRGLLFNQKTALPGSNLDKLRHALHQAVQYCRRLEQEPSLLGKLAFRGDAVAICVNDRLLAPNTLETFEALRHDLEAAGAVLFGAACFALHRDEDPEHRFTVHLEAQADFTMSQLLANLSRGE